MMDVTVLDEVHDYWFGDLGKPPVPKELMDRWFRPTEAVDNHIRETFGPHLDAARATEWNLPELSKDRQIALVVMLDQFPRQIWRKSGEAFAYDWKALSVARQLVAGGVGRFHHVERVFLFLPFEHSENVADQDEAVLLYATEAVAIAEDAKEGARQTLDYATKHRDIIRKFGRFPHRNEMLGRESTPEEIEFLKGGRGF
jgi:uncharacterized protein (DUF924 family)